MIIPRAILSLLFLLPIAVFFLIPLIDKLRGKWYFRHTPPPVNYTWNSQYQSAYSGPQKTSKNKRYSILILGVVIGYLLSMWCTGFGRHLLVLSPGIDGGTTRTFYEAYFHPAKIKGVPLRHDIGFMAVINKTGEPLLLQEWQYTDGCINPEPIRTEVVGNNQAAYVNDYIRFEFKDPSTYYTDSDTHSGYTGTLYSLNRLD